MPRRARIALSGAVIAATLMAVVWWLSHDVAVVRQADADALGGFVALRRPRLDLLTGAIARLCNPVPYVIWAVPVAVALLRGRPRVAVMLAAVLLGANETTEVLKPLLGGARDAVPGFSSLGDATWPSGHATAAMTLALSAVICAPARRRPAVAAAMAAFTVAIVFSFLELGWHYPSDAVGGFLVAALWAQFGLAALWTYEAHRPALATRTAAARPAFSVGQALAPSAVIITVALAAGGLLALLRPHQVFAYATGHLGFVVVAAVIAAAAFTLASALSLLMRDGSLRVGAPGPSAGTGELAPAGR
jgi:membrane-associated phospholipid phosphatase